MNNFDIQEIIKRCKDLEDYKDIAKDYFHDNGKPYTGERMRQIFKWNIDKWEYKKHKYFMSEHRRNERENRRIAKLYKIK